MATVLPRTWGLLLLALEMYLLYRAIFQGRARAVWLLIPVFVLWANIDQTFLTGLVVLAETAIASSPDTAGEAYALAAAVCQALYLLAGKRLSRLPDAVAVPWGTAIGACVAVLLGRRSGGHLLSPVALEMGSIAAVVSSVIPNTLEMLSMKHLPHRTLGVLYSSAPAFAALPGSLSGRGQGVDCVMSPPPGVCRS